MAPICSRTDLARDDQVDWYRDGYKRLPMRAGDEMETLTTTERSETNGANWLALLDLTVLLLNLSVSACVGEPLLVALISKELGSARRGFKYYRDLCCFWLRRGSDNKVLQWDEQHLNFSHDSSLDSCR